MAGGAAGLGPGVVPASLAWRQAATVIVEHLAYDPIEGRHDMSIFTQAKSKEDFGRAYKASRHVFEYVTIQIVANDINNAITELSTIIE